MNLGPSPEERRLAELEAVIRGPLRGRFKIGVMGKGGVGKTTVSACIGSLLAELRPDDRVVAIDYKSNAEVPATPRDVPDGILRQMAAYRAALALIYPGRRIEAAVLWTAARALMDLPGNILEAALAGIPARA